MISDISSSYFLVTIQQYASITSTLALQVLAL